MFETAIALSLRFIMVVGVAQLLLNVIGANLYEVRAVKRQRRYRDHPYARRYRVRPLVSVIIVSHNSEQFIESCLNSVLKSTYRNLEVIVVDNVSDDATRQRVALVIAANPQHIVKLFAKRVSNQNTRAALDGYKRYGNGDLIMTLEAAQTLDKATLMTAVRYFSDDERLDTVTPKLNVNAAFSSLGVLQKYMAVLNSRSSKARGVFNIGRSVDGPMMCRRAVFTTSVATGKLSGRRQYADDVIVNTRPPESFFQMISQNFNKTIKQSRVNISLELNWSRPLDWLFMMLAASTGLAALLVPLLAGYFIYLAAVLQEPTYLLVGCGLLSLLLLFAIWEDRQLRLYQKLNYTLGIPLTYGLYLSVSVIQACAVITAILTPGKVQRAA
jgi:glycosyltransferase involved in cell wall biosynthesis